MSSGTADRYDSTAAKKAVLFIVRSARLSVGLQVQETTLRSFFDRSNGLARGSGFLSRFLISWPVSTQGSRMYTEPPESWPALSRLHRHIAGLLNTEVPMQPDGMLDPP